MEMNVEPRGTSTGPQPPEFDPTGAMEGSAFLAKVREKFYNEDGTSNWPGRPEPTHDARAKVELPAALDALFRRVAFHEALPPEPPEPAETALTALGRLKAAAVEVNWPGAAAIPVAWPALDERTYRLYEVACAVNIMIRAFNDSGGGGGPRDFPPPGSP